MSMAEQNLDKAIRKDQEHAETVIKDLIRRTTEELQKINKGTVKVIPCGWQEIHFSIDNIELCSGTIKIGKISPQMITGVDPLDATKWYKIMYP